MGARTLRHWLTRPLLHMKEIQFRQEAITELKDMDMEPIVKQIKRIGDAEKHLLKINYGRISPAALYSFLATLIALSESFLEVTPSKSELLMRIWKSVLEVKSHASWVKTMRRSAADEGNLNSLWIQDGLELLRDVCSLF
jgi:DNA mismatch repair ATPase MutS